MYQVSYLLEQVWLAHQEMGLGPLVRVEMWVLAILLACWPVEWLLRQTGWFARRSDLASTCTTIQSLV